MQFCTVMVFVIVKKQTSILPYLFQHLIDCVVLYRAVTSYSIVWQHFCR
jgi:hypothetical protein